MAQPDYERIGKLIYGACRYGADQADIIDWLANDLKLERPDPGDNLAVLSLYTAFAAKYSAEEAFQANCERFFEELKRRGS